MAKKYERIRKRVEQWVDEGIATSVIWQQAHDEYEDQDLPSEKQFQRWVKRRRSLQPNPALVEKRLGQLSELRIDGANLLNCGLQVRARRPRWRGGKK